MRSFPLALLVPLLLALGLILAACAGGNGASPLADLAVSGVTPARLSHEGGPVAVSGENFFEVLSGRGFAAESSVRLCGVALADVRVEGEERRFVAPPGAAVTLRMGDRLTGTLPPHAQVGPGDVVVTRPDGQTVTLEGAVDCYDPAPRIEAFAVGPDPVQAGLATTFTWTVASPDAHALACTLDPGDGSGPSEIGDCLATTDLEHTYATEEGFVATLTATDADGRTAASELTVAVGNAPPVAAFSAAPESGEAPLTVDLDAAASLDPNGLIASYAWDFGDGAQATGAQVQHTFARGSYTVTLTVTDDDGATGTATRAVHVDNGLPGADPQAVTTDEDVPLAITLTGSDPDGDALSYAITSAPPNGTLTGTAPDLTYTPDADWNGSDGFTFEVDDGNGGSDAATVHVTVEPVNDAPTAAAATVEGSEDVALAVELGGSDPEGSDLTFAVATGPDHGVLTGTAPDLVYTPDPDWFGTDSFNFTVTDEAGAEDDATVTLNVASVNDAPVFTSDPLEAVDEGTAYLYQVVVTDVDTGDGGIDDVAITAPTLPDWLELVDEGSGSARLTGTPARADVGSAAVVLAAHDGVTGVDQSFTITVHLVNGDPIITSDPVTTVDLGSSYAYAFTATDPDGDDLTVTASTLPEWLALSDGGDGTATLSGTPGVTDVGTHPVTLQVSDGLATVDQAFSVEVVSPPDDPVVQSFTIDRNPTPRGRLNTFEWQAGGPAGGSGAVACTFYAGTDVVHDVPCSASFLFTYSTAGTYEAVVAVTYEGRTVQATIDVVVSP